MREYLLEYITILTSAVFSINRRANELAECADLLGGRQGALMRAEAGRYRAGIVSAQNELAAAVGTFMPTYGEAP